MLPLLGSHTQPLSCLATPPLFRPLFLLTQNITVDLNWLPCLHPIYPVYLCPISLPNDGSDHCIPILKNLQLFIVTYGIKYKLYLESPFQLLL